MPVFIYTPGERRGPDVGRATRDFLADPLGTVAFGIAGRYKGDPYRGTRTEFDTDTGQVRTKFFTTVEAASAYFDTFKDQKPTRGGPRGTEKGLSARDAVLLRQAFDTGTVPAAMPAYLRDFATQIALESPIRIPPLPEGVNEPIAGEGITITPPGVEFFMPTRFEVPPGGYAGFAQQTVAGQRQQLGLVRAARRRSAGGAGTRAGSRTQASGRYALIRRPGYRKLVKRTARAAATRRKRGRKTRPRLVKGSAAAKRYMAKIRRMRGK